MYSVQSSGSLARNLTARGIKNRVGTTVLLLGTCSLLTDISSEMVSAILPLYLVFTLGFTPLQYGVVDGIYQGAAALINLASGYVGDRWRRHKVVAATGYGLSAVCKLGLAVIGGAWAGLSALILLDRTGKGIRTAPRDAMISLTAPKRELGFAFGVHRAMDTAGAMIGPLVAFALLAAAPNAFHSLFLISFFIAVLGFLVIAMLVRQPEKSRPAQGEAGPARRDRPAGLARVPRSGHRRRRARAGHGERRLHLPDAARPDALRQPPVPPAAHGHGRPLHVPGGAAGAPGRQGRPRQGLHGRLRAAAPRLLPAHAPVRRHRRADRRAGAARHVLRRHR